MSTLPSWSFTTFEEGIDFIGQNPGAYVLKPCGAAGDDKKLVLIGDAADGSDVAQALLLHLAKEPPEPFEYVLQQKVVGVEVAIAGFFNGEHFLEPLSIGFEHKRYFPGDVGPLTGEMGTSMFWSRKNRLFEETLAKMTATLRRERYHGSFDINCMVNEAGIYPLEFTSRFGFPQLLIQTEGIDEPLGTFLWALAKGGTTRFQARPGFQVGVQLRLPPYPYQDSRSWERLSKDILLELDWENPDAGLHPQDVKCVDGRWRLALQDGCPCVVCGTGLTMRDAQRQAYERVARIKLPNVYYRNDIGNGWHERSEVDKLLMWGYL